ncbi:ABC transporter ATP-binding protein [Kosmotoga pacifica]|uniref:Multidrug ABC transporter ATP-binding protein n=1 Tax=Kosmotoga pacifica TaxID=1330330 RepID=A0A0G2ZDJ9_9BACT|nr:ABC transporter ATP-binding protein [Kosmotoga pacifica]AKI96898.1 multidrug ABC transporter ATP-binding protein [Kosmotoga pacifica]
MLRIEELKKSYGHNTAVDGISFTVESGEVFALLGPNGAGKTTTLKCILGLRKIDGGSVKLDGTVAYLPEEKNLYPSYSIERLIAFTNDLTEGFDMSKAFSTVKEFGIGLQEKITNLSHGMLTLVYLALVFAQKADIYIMDEPTWGLDPLMRTHAMRIIKELAVSGKTILYTSHILSEVEKLADTVAIMNNGKILEMGRIEELKSRYAAVTVEKGKKVKGFLWRSTQTGDIYILRREKGLTDYEEAPFDAIFEAVVRGDAR